MAKLAKIKTQETEANVEDFLNAIKEEDKRTDSFTLLKLMQKISKEEPKMWGSAMIGFGSRIYKSPATGREVNWFKIGFAPRKANISLHLVHDMSKLAPMLKKLGKHKTGSGCLYITKLEEIDMKVLEEIIKVAASLK